MLPATTNRNAPYPPCALPHCPLPLPRLHWRGRSPASLVLLACGASMPTARACLAALACLVAAAALAPAADELPKMKFNEVKEVAPGVFFRYSSIGPEGSKIPFGGSNHIWVVFEDYVAVIDANFPKEAADVIAD